MNVLQFWLEYIDRANKLTVPDTTVMTDDELIKKLIDIVQSEVGTREFGGNNRGDKIVEYQKATWLKPDNWPWCAAFTCWTLKQWINIPQVRDRLNLKSDKDVEAWRCKDASAFGWLKWADKQGLKVLTETDIAKAGDIVVFDFSHIGWVVKDQISMNTSINTVEGNTNGRGERDSISGDGVWAKIRAPKLTKCYIRILNT